MTHELSIFNFRYHTVHKLISYKIPIQAIKKKESGARKVATQ